MAGNRLRCSAVNNCAVMVVLQCRTWCPQTAPVFLPRHELAVSEVADLMLPPYLSVERRRDKDDFTELLSLFSRPVSLLVLALIEMFSY